MNLIGWKNVKLTDGFWKDKQKINRDVTSDAIWKRFSDTGRIDAFNFDWQAGMENKPHFFWDSDVAKWMEATAYMLYEQYDAQLEERIEQLIDCIQKNQCEDGYFNIYFTVVEPEKRFQGRMNHELYCAGHLIEAAVAYFDATGKNEFLDCMKKYVDYIYLRFVEEKSVAFVTPGHEEIELSLLRLYHCTKEKKHLALAEFFIDNRGKAAEEDTTDAWPPIYIQSHLPVRSQKTAVGHCVRACYLYKGMADLANETKDTELLEACKNLFKDIVTKKMYVTGGIGSTHIGEAFTLPYDLPNETAYSETCAAISMAMFSQSMLQMENDSVYADIVEREFYNGMLSGISLDGKAFFYENPLEINLKNHKRCTATVEKDRLPITQRMKVFECSCCPPNINRVLASMAQYVYGFEDGEYYVNQFMGSEMTDGEHQIIQKTQYPLNGTIQLQCENIPALMIRIPGWCKKFTVDCAYEKVGGYIRVENPSEIHLDFDMKPMLLRADANVRNNVGKVALQLGPVVYCLESVDNTENLHALYINQALETKVSYDEKFGLNTITARGYKNSTSCSMIYSDCAESFEDCSLKFIPYSCFANRGEADMLVWISVK